MQLCVECLPCYGVVYTRKMLFKSIGVMVISIEITSQGHFREDCDRALCVYSRLNRAVI